MVDISDTLLAKSDQLNADDIVSGPITLKVERVNKVSAPDQPIVIHYEGENGRPFKPCKTVRRILGKAWGTDASQWAGRLMTVYNEPSVKWAGKPVGGIRVSHLSNINGTIEISLQETKGKKTNHKIKPLKQDTKPQGSPVNNTEPANTDPNAPNIRLIKTDGSAMQLPSFEAWIEMINNNLPMMKELDRIIAFEKNHEPIFQEYDAQGHGDWVQKVRLIIKQNKERLGASDEPQI